jgi:hypothetical protein
LVKTKTYTKFDDKVSSLIEYLEHLATAAFVFICIAFVAVIVHLSAHVFRRWLPKVFSWTIEAVAWLLFFLDVIGFVLLVLDQSWKFIPEDFRAAIRHLLSRGGP